jgi:molybdate/tungstate transport system substrate-binding protein
LQEVEEGESMTRNNRRSAAISVIGLLMLTARGARTVAAQTALRVAYAGSMGAVMDQKIGPAFAKAHDVEFQGIGQGAYALTHLIESKQVQVDVFVPVTAGPMRILLKNGMVKQATPVASTQMALVYGPKSRFAEKFAEAAQGKGDWRAILEQPGLRFGRTDPATDPQGRNVIFTMMLAEKYYHRAGLVNKVLGPLRNEAQIFAEPSLLTRLESGQLDASIGYLSAIKSQHLPFIKLPPEINLADPAEVKPWYSTVSFPVVDKTGKTITAQPEPLVFYAAAMIGAAHPAAAGEFVEFLKGDVGQRLFREAGYDPPLGGALD